MKKASRLQKVDMITELGNKQTKKKEKEKENKKKGQPIVSTLLQVFLLGS